MSSNRTTRKEMLSLLARIAATFDGPGVDSPTEFFALYDEITATLEEAEQEETK